METELPKNWVNTNLESVADWGSGGTPSRKNKDFFQGKIPWIKTGELGEKYIWSSEEHITEQAIAKSSAKLFPKGSVGIAMYGATIGKLSMWGIDASTNQACAVAQIHPETLFNEYLYYFLMSEKRNLILVGKGGAQPNISQGVLKAWKISLAPLNEQKRIVAKIEELFSELDKGVESLKTARAQLKIYRQAVLKHAFEGKLTAQWREDNKDKLETADELQKCIQKEREARHQQQLEDWKALVVTWEQDGKGGKRPAKPRKLAKPEEIGPQELEGILTLPNSWRWCKMGQLFSVYVGSTPSRKKQEFWAGSIPWVSSGEVAFCRITDTREKITAAGYDSASTQIHPIGTVMLAMIGEGKTRGQAAILDIEASHNQNTAAIRVSETDCSVSFFYNFLLYQYEITRKLGSGNNQKALNKDRVSNMFYPLAPIKEQKEIAKKIDLQLSILEHLEKDILENLERGRALRQSILKKAFSGKLVAQDPNDEPASVLLERIKAEKNIAGKPKKVEKVA